MKEQKINRAWIEEAMKPNDDFFKMRLPKSLKSLMSEQATKEGYSSLADYVRKTCFADLVKKSELIK